MKNEVKLNINGYAKAIRCKVEPTVIYLARVRIEESGFKLYYNCSRDVECDARNCIFKRYLEKEVNVDFFGEKGKIDEYGEIVKNEIAKIISKYPVEKVGVWFV